MYSRAILFFNILIILLLSHSQISAQSHGQLEQRKIDSIATILRSKSLKDTITVNRMHELSRLLTQEGQSDLALQYNTKAKKIAEAINYNKGIATYYSILGAIQRDKGNISQSLISLDKALELNKAWGTKREKAYIYDQLGHSHWVNNDTIKALNSHKQALQIRKESNDLLKQAYSYDNIAQIYVSFADHKTAIYYFTKALNIYIKLNSPRTALASGNVGLINSYIENNNEALKNFLFASEKYEQARDTAGIIWMYNGLAKINYKIKNFKKSLEYSHKTLSIHQRKKDESGIADSYTLMGQAYSEMNEFDKSYDYLSKALQTRKVKKDSVAEMNVLYNLGDLYHKQKKYPEAIASLSESLKLAEILNYLRYKAYCKRHLGLIFSETGRPKEAQRMLTEALEYLKNDNSGTHLAPIYKELAKTDSINGNYRSAFENYKRYVASLKNDVKGTQDTQKTAMRYEYEKKDAVAKAELKTKKIQRNYAIVALVVMILATIFILFFFRLRNKKLKIEKHILELQNREVENIKKTEQFKSRFLTNISHEFRTPLTLINGHLEVLKENGRQEDQEHFHEMEQNGKRLLTLINQLLDLSKMESGEYKLQYKRGDILNEASMLVQSFHSYAQQQGIDLVLQKTQAATHHLKDKSFAYASEALAVIINNLISNAIKYTPSGGKVLVNIDYRDEHFHVSVTDTGKGIAAEHVSKVFDRFYQVDEPGQRTYAGSGIGLALVKELAMLHGGNVTVESPVEGGCIFAFWIANSVGEIEETQEYVTANITDETVVQLDSDNIPKANVEFPLVLVVEDQPELRQFIVNNLGSEYRYMEAANGKSGALLAEEFLPDLIISDVMMPDVDGFELCNLLKNGIATSHIPIILLTAKADQEDIIAGLEFGADDYLTKPFSLAELRLRVKNILHFKELIRAKFTTIDNQTAVETSELSSKDKKFINDLIQTVEDHLADTQFGVSILAESVFLSVSQLTRKLKALTHKTPAEFIRDIRFQKAVELLKQGESVTNVSWAVGFEDAVYFSKVFKKHIGTSPSQFKN